MTASRVLIARSGIPEHEAVRLLALAAGVSPVAARIGVDIPDASTCEAFSTLVSRRLAGEPLQYIEGDVPFGPVTVGVDPRVLIPRPETEELLELCIAECEAPRVIVDLCTGSGALAVALAALHDADVHGTDVDGDALDVARGNAAANGVEVSFHRGDLFDALPPSLAGTIDCLVSNPPYLTPGEYDQVPADVAREPRHALVSGPTGAEFIDRIGEAAPRWLAPGGVVLCEISEYRADAATAAFAGLGGRIVEDLRGKPRFVVGRSPVE